MTRRTRATVKGPDGSPLWARVMWDSEWEEFVVLVYRNSVRATRAEDYHTNDLEDAKLTAASILNSMAAREVQA